MWFSCVLTLCLGVLVLFGALPSSSQVTNRSLPIVTVVAPYTIHEHSDYTVSISLDPLQQEQQPEVQYDLPIVIRVSIVNGNVASKVVSFTTVDTIDDVSISVGALPKDGDPYHLEVKAYSGSARGSKPLIPFFHRKKVLHVARRTHSIYLYTDRAAYKPGDLLQFRVLAMDRRLRPVSIILHSIELRDTSYNVIKLWRNVGLDEFGFFSDSIQLSTQLVLGEWSLRVQETENVKDGKAFHRFRVVEFILPKFGARVILSSSYLTFEDSQVVATIKSLYTHGAPVEGHVEVAVNRIHYRIDYDEETGDPIEHPVLTKSATLRNGTAQIKFDVIKELDEEWDKVVEYNYINITATVYEKVTGLKYTESVKVPIYTSSYNIYVFNQEHYYWLGGPPINLTVHVTTPDGHGSPATGSPISLEYYFGNRLRSDKQVISSTIKDGKAIFIIRPTETLRRQFTVSFKSVVKTFDFPDQIHLPTKVAASSTQKSDTVSFTVQRLSHAKSTGATFEATAPSHSRVSLNCLLITRSQGILSSNRKTFRSVNNTNSTTSKARFRVDVAALNGLDISSGEPVQLIAYTASKNKFSAQLFEIEIGRSQWLDIQLSTDTTEPGSNITMMALNSSSGSLIAFRAIDQSMLLLDSDEELDSDKLITISHRFDEPKSALVKESGYAPFTSANLILMTNAEECLSHDDCKEVCVMRFCVDVCSQVCPIDAPCLITPDGLAHCYGVGASGSSGVQLPDGPIQVRTHFPEVWLWDFVRQNSSNFPVTMKLTVPDTITSWVFSAFAIRPGQPLALADRRELIVTRPFFVTLNVPYAVVTWEKVAVQVLVHNNLGQDVDAEVQLTNSRGDFQFLNPNATSDVWSQRVNVPAGAVRSFSFKISPLVFGTIELAVRARCALAGDALIHRLVVRPPGVKKVKNKATLVRLNPHSGTNGSSTLSEANVELKVEFPQGRVSGADTVTLSLVGDLLGPALSNLDNLLQMPSGSGEQNMVHVVPGIVVLNYVTVTGALTPAIKAKGTRFLESGYQRELTYAHNDGSFSAFGNRDPAGSTWLTAFVARAFHAAKSYISVHQSVIDQALTLLVSRQQEDGSFEELQQLLSRDTVGGWNNSGHVLTQTAYALLAFLEAGNGEYSQVIESGLKFLVGVGSRRSMDAYVLALVTYALHLAWHPKKADFMKKLDDTAVVDTPGGTMHWESSSPLHEALALDRLLTKRSDTNAEIRAVDIEMTAYALLTYIHAGRVAEALPIVRWRIAQRNPEGGFLSTQDTVVALTALRAYAAETAAEHGETQLEITAKTRGQDSRSSPTTLRAAVNKDNAIVLQQFQLQQDTRTVDFTAKGRGLALVQLTNTFWVQGTAARPDSKREAFKVAVKADGHGKRFKLQVCTHATALESAHSMVIVEVNLPTGFTLNQEQVRQAVKLMPGSKRHELSNGDSTVNIYLDSLPAPRQLPSCVSLTADLVHRVIEQSPAYVHVYDYYDPAKRGMATYTTPQLLAFCEDDEDENFISCV